MTLSPRIKRLYRVVMVQKALRFGLRSVWLGGAAYLICWGINAFTGLLPNADLWEIISAVFGLLIFLTVFIKPVKLIDFIWRVDRKFSLREQITTAHQVTTKGRRDTEGYGSLDALLVEDVISLMPEITRRVLGKGWRIRTEIEAIVVVGLLLLVVNLSAISSFRAVVPGSGLGLLPGLGSDPSYLDVFPSGIPGDTHGAKFDPLQAELSPAGESELDMLDSFSDLELEKIKEGLKQVGEGLSDNPVTSGFGNALAKEEFSQGAVELDFLTENIDRLTDGTQQQIADQFYNFVRELYSPRYQSITIIFSAAAEALEEGDAEEISAQMSQVSELLSRLGERRANQLLGDSGKEEPEDLEIERLSGEGADFELGSAGDISDILTVPGSGNPDSRQVADEIVDLIGNSLEISEDSELPVYSYSWEDKNVVSSYFTPR